MRTFSYIKSKVEAEKAFSFLIDEFHYSLCINEYKNYGFLLEYSSDGIRIHLFCDYRDNFFYFKIIKGVDTVYPNDHDKTNIKTFYEIIDKYNLGIDYNLLQPNNDQYIDALKLNAKILKEYGSKILKGEEWF